MSQPHPNGLSVGGGDPLRVNGLRVSHGHAREVGGGVYGI